MTEQRLDLNLSSQRALEVVREAVHIWGGEVEAGGDGLTLWLPVNTGIRTGHIVVRVRVTGDAATARVEIQPTEAHMRIHRGAAVVLGFGAAGGLVAILWPFFPRLLQLAPVAAVLAVVAWLLVASRSRSHDLAEFLELVEKMADEAGSNHAPRMT